MESNLENTFVYISDLLYLRAQDESFIKPQIQVVPVGQEFFIYCFSETLPNWSKSSSKNVFDVNSNPLVIQSAAFSDTGTYICRGTRKQEKFEAHADVFVAS